MSRFTAVIVALLMLTGSVGRTTCVGWEQSREEREDCCRRARHADCLQQGAADSCCAGHQDALQIAGPTFTSVAVLAPAAVVVSYISAPVALSAFVPVLERSQRLLQPPTPPPRPLRI
jgi:hypothetical protein